MNYFFNCLNFIGSNIFFLTIMFTSFIIKGCLLALLCNKGMHASRHTKLPLIFLIGILFGATVGDFGWIVKYLRILVLPFIPYSFFVFMSRMGYAFLIIQYHSLALFTKAITQKVFKLHYLEKILLSIGTLFFGYFSYTALFDNNLTSEVERTIAMSKSFFDIDSPLELKMTSYTGVYILPLIAVMCIIILIQNSYNNRQPKILKHQINILIKTLIFPFLVLESLIAFHVILKLSEFYTKLTVGLSTILVTVAVAYCMKKIMALRFLNFGNYVESKKKFNFINDFADLLEQLSKSQTTEEVGQVVKQFCKDALSISLNKISFHTRSFDNISSDNSPHDLAIQNFLNNHSSEVCTFINAKKILVYDEILFSNYYEEDAIQQQIIEFLDSINADIFLPIYQDGKKIAAVIIQRNALGDRLYTKVNQDELVIFATYVGNIFNLLQSRSLELNANQKKALQEELYQKHQEIRQYKESLDSFIRNRKQAEIGIIFYKNRRFSFANQTAKNIVGVNLNMQEGHPLSRAIKKVARQVEEYKTPKTSFAHDKEGNTLVISGVLHMEQNSIIITIYYPGISDIVKKQMHLLKDPSHWDYLLYLETTEMGKLIDQILPGDGETLLNFKIELLKAALSKKAILLDLALDDLIPTVELLHHVSLREQLHTIKLSEPVKDTTLAKKLFGINPLLSQGNQEKSLLEKLDNSGTLYIKNVQYVDLDTQEALATYIQYGYFSPLYSEHRINTNVRIICSSNAPLKNLVIDGSFSANLLNELKKMSLSMPSLITLPEKELMSLADGFSKQAIKTDNFANLLTLTDKEKHKIINTKPASLQQLKTRVQQILTKKTERSHIQETEFDPAYTISDPSLIEAGKLGKHALRDRTIMAMLWSKFNKNQHQIALFLGVNRSSVSRRCKEYGLYNHELGEYHA